MHCIENNYLRHFNHIYRTVLRLVFLDDFPGVCKSCPYSPAHTPLILKMSKHKKKIFNNIILFINTWTGVSATCLQVSLGVLREAFRHRLVRQRPSLRMVELALVAVRTLLAIGTRWRWVTSARLLAKELVQRRTCSSQRIIRRHEPTTL